MSSIFFQKLKIENYKCFSDHEIQLSKPDGITAGSGLNVLIGENGNGKTSLLEALNLIGQSSFAAENRININDFSDHSNPIKISVETPAFVCNMPDLYRGCTFNSTGIEFQAKSRNRKAPGKLLSSPLQINSKFITTESSYLKANGESAKKAIPPLATSYSSGAIKSDNFNVFYFDKNRTRQLSSGTYKTTFERICDDLNWRFVKNLEDTGTAEMLKTISDGYFLETMNIARKGTGKKLSEEVSNFFGDQQFQDLRIDLLDLLHPFTNAFFAVRPDDRFKQIAPKNLGSGVEIILTLLLLRSISSESKGSIIYLIDEPELHLHPSAQQKLAELLLAESVNSQIVVSTHSPYLIRGFMTDAANKIILTRDGNGIDVSYPATSTNKLFPWSPSWGEVNYRAYNMATVEFHNELYGWLQEKHSIFMERDVEIFLETQGVSKSRQWIKERNGVAQQPYPITLCSYVRNSIHHPENRNNTIYSERELFDSIETLISMLT